MAQEQGVQSLRESDYFAFRNFDTDNVRRARAFYETFLDDRSRVLELGCGRGEFLDVVRPSVERAVGVDSDEGMIEAARARGHEAVRADLFDFLDRGWSGAPPDFIFAAHLIEHLEVADAREMIQRSAALLAPGGRMVVVTPNPASLRMIGGEFWADPTHVRPYASPLIRFLFDLAGLKTVATGGNPLDNPGPPPNVQASIPDRKASDVDLPAEPTRAQSASANAIQGDAASAEIEQLRQTVARLAAETERANAVAEHVVAAHNELLRHLFGAHEIYVVAERPES